MFFLLILLVFVVFLLMRQYNRLQGLAQRVREAHANVMASMKKRIDLTNKLIDIAKGYADHEKLTHISVAQTGDDMSAGAGAAAGAINQVMRIASQFPDLKANATFQQLMGQLDAIETDLQGKRETYNAVVSTYNTAIGQLPVSLYASQLGFRAAPYFDVDNADALENLRGFHSEDSEHLKQIGKIAVEKGMEKGAELQRQAAERAAAGSVPGQTAASTQPPAPQPGSVLPPPEPPAPMT
jgi:LemA protein